MIETACKAIEIELHGKSLRWQHWWLISWVDFYTSEHILKLNFNGLTGCFNQLFFYIFAITEMVFNFFPKWTSVSISVDPLKHFKAKKSKINFFAKNRKNPWTLTYNFENAKTLFFSDCFHFWNVLPDTIDKCIRLKLSKIGWKLSEILAI